VCRTNHLRPWPALTACTVLAACAGPALGTILGATVADVSSSNYTLTSLTVTRGSAGTFTYLPSQLTGVDLTDVASVQLPLAVQSGASVPAIGSRATLLEDGRLDTGVINPFSTAAAATDSFEVTFLEPVVNSAGEDIVILEIGGGDPTRFWINNDRAGKGFEVTAASFTAPLITGMTFTLYKYANGTDQNVDGLAELESPTGFAFDKNDTGNIVALGLDLSSFGVPVGSSISSIRFQSVGLARIDPVFIAGLPALPLPGDANEDGQIDPDDYALIDRGFARYQLGTIPPGLASWRDGDFNRDGVVNSQDYLLIDQSFAASQPPSPHFLAARAAEFGDAYVNALHLSIPEPTSLLAACGLVLPLLSRRRQNP
jgi:hypothetical protein